MAYIMISIFGMNDKVGQVSFYGMSNESYQKPYSDHTAMLIDEEVRRLVNSQYERAKELLRERHNELEIIAKALLEKEVLHTSDVERLIGPRPYANEERIKMNGHTAEPTAPIGDHGDIVPNP
jgi:cell division protease FtsH